MYFSRDSALRKKKRRLTAGCLLRKSFDFEKLALENHLNYIYHQERELSSDETYGIAAIFNSKLFDGYFRIFSGNTQVNATEVRSMSFPSLKDVAKIGNKIRHMRERSPQSVENIVLDALRINGNLKTFLLGALS